MMVEWGLQEVDGNRLLCLSEHPGVDWVEVGCDVDEKTGLE